MRGEAKIGLDRRQALVGLAAVVVAGGPAAAGPARISAQQAHAAAARGDNVFIDIRTPQEWRSTGIGERAVAISMHEPGFIEKLDRLVAGDRSRPISLICAQGVRSNAMQRMLAQQGFANVMDVSEGMMGGPNGAGWIARGLPVRPVTP